MCVCVCDKFGITFKVGTFREINHYDFFLISFIQGISEEFLETFLWRNIPNSSWGWRWSTVTSYFFFFSIENQFYYYRYLETIYKGIYKH